jgi:hypothetical protein
MWYRYRERLRKNSAFRKLQQLKKGLTLGIDCRSIITCFALLLKQKCC